jgi:AcrR family transcriptional regulator
VTSDLTSKTTLQTLRETTEQLVAEKGCQSTTIRDIVKRAGVSMGGIYHYVRSKDELFGLILQARIEEIDRRFREAVSRAACGDLHSPLHVIVDGFMRLITEETQVFRKVLLYLVSRQDNPEIAKVLSDFHAKWREICETWIEVGKAGGAIPAALPAQEAGSLLVTFYLGVLIESSLSVTGQCKQRIFRFTEGVLTQPQRL